MSRNPQVVVVGGGPAGTTVAILAASYGLRVTLIEAAPYPRYMPGDALPPEITRYFDTLGIRERVFAEHTMFYQGNRVRWQGEGDLFRIGPDETGQERQGLLIPRFHLDSILIERAAELGVRVLHPCVVRGIQMRMGRLRAVETDQGLIRADIIVDAAGSRHWLARKLELPMRYHSPPLYGVYGWAEGHCEKRYEWPLIEADPNGWTWTSRVAENRYQYTRLTFTKEDYDADWLPVEFLEAGLKGMFRPRGADLTWRRVLQSSGPGYFLVGDALCRTDPLVQLGAFKAMNCAFKLALMLDAIFNSKVAEEEVRQDYEAWIEDQCMRELTILRGYYQRHPDAPREIQNLEPRDQTTWRSPAALLAGA